MAPARGGRLPDGRKEILRENGRHQGDSGIE